MATTPPAIAQTLTPPSRASSPVTFSADMDTFLGALPTWGTQVVAIGTNVYNNAVEAATSAGSVSTVVATATTKAGEALAYANAASASSSAASTSATNATTQANAASGSATAASNSATSALTRAEAAAQSAQSAAAVAASMVGGPVVSVNGLTGVVTIPSLVTGFEQTFLMMGA